MDNNIFIYAILLIFSISSVNSVCPFDRTDLTLFSSYSSWNQVNASVVIPSGAKILLDVSPPQLQSITVGGELIFANKNLQLSLEWMKINTTGSLQIGSIDTGCYITSSITITFRGIRTYNNIIGVDPFDNTPLGYKGLVALTGASIEIVGNTTGKTWTRLASNAMSGSNTITVSDSVDWKAGDTIVIATTDFSMTIPWEPDYPESINWQLGRGSPDQNEKRNITSIVNGAGNTKVITLSSPLTYTHWGSDYERAEVGLLTRNVVIQGDVSSDSSRFGAHILIRRVNKCHFHGVELKRMGQKGLLGRYPFHFHVAKDVYGLGYSVKANSVSNSYQRCYVVHYTSGVTVQNNVAFNNVGHCYFLEDGSERGNILDSNLGISIAPVPDIEDDALQLIPTDSTPSMFWITNPNNTITNNAAVGGRFGYWFSLPDSPSGASVSDFLNDPWVRPRWTPLGVFDGNVAHSTSLNGLHIDDMVDHLTLKTTLASFTPRQGPYNTTDDWQYESVIAVFNNFLSYKNRQYGVWARGGPSQFQNFKLLDNLRGFNAPPEPSLLINSLIVGETNNIGFPLAQDYGRSRPDPWNTYSTVKGWETYDNGGSQYCQSTTFVNFTSDSVRKAGAISQLECGPFLLQTRDQLRNLTFINANQVYISPCDYYDADCPRAWSIFDGDGSLTGFASGKWVVSANSTLLVGPNCTPKPEWNAEICDPFEEGRYNQLQVQLIGAGNLTEPAYQGAYSTNFSYYEPHVMFFELGSDGQHSFNGTGNFQYGTENVANMIVSGNMKPRRSYALRFIKGTPTPPNIMLQLASSITTDWIYVAIPYPPSAFPITIVMNQWQTNYVNLQRVYSLQEVTTKNVYYYDTTTEHLYVRLECIDTTINPRWEFLDIPGVDGYAIHVTSECGGGNGTDCQVPTKLALPPPYIPLIPEDRFQATLQQCQSTINNSPVNSGGDAFFWLDPTQKTLTYHITHGQGVSTQKISIYRGSTGTNGVRLIDLAYPNNPVHFSMQLTRYIWMSLLRGELYLSVQTNSEKLRGQIGCVGNCSLPPPASSVIPCTTQAYGTHSIVVYSDNALQSNWWSYLFSGSPNVFNTTISFTNTENVLCGSSSIKLQMSDGAWVFGVYPHLFISSANYSFIQFYMRLGYNDGLILFNFHAISDDDDTQIGNVTLKDKYVDNFYIDGLNYTRIRIPLVDLGFSANQELAKFLLYRSDWGWMGKPITMYIDDFRITGNVPDPKDVGISLSEIYHHDHICDDQLGVTSSGSTSTSGSVSSSGSNTGTHVTSSSGSTGSEGSTTDSIKYNNSSNKMSLSYIVSVISIVIVSILSL